MNPEKEIFIKDLLRELNERVICCVLKNSKEPFSEKDVDLLVLKEDWVTVRNFFIERGFLEAVQHSIEQNTLYIAFTESFGWIVFDIHTEFGRFGKWRGIYKTHGFEEKVLKQAVIHDGIRVISAANEAIALSFQILGGFGKKKYSDRILTLLSVEETERELKNFYNTLNVDSEKVVGALKGELPLEEVSREVITPIRRHFFTLTGFLIARNFLDMIFTSLMKLLCSGRVGLTVALLGIDGSGKSTLADLLKSSLPCKTKEVYMGWKDFSSSFLFWSRMKEKNNSQYFFIKKALGAVSAVVTYFEFLSRFLKASFYAYKGWGVVFDRYVYDFFVDALVEQRKSKPLLFLYSRVFPAPDSVIFLDVDESTLLARKPHENEIVDTVRRKRELYIEFQSVYGWKIAPNDRTPEEGLRNLSRIMWEELKKRGGPSRKVYLAIK